MKDYTRLENLRIDAWDKYFECLELIENSNSKKENSGTCRTNC